MRSEVNKKKQERGFEEQSIKQTSSIQWYKSQEANHQAAKKPCSSAQAIPNPFSGFDFVAMLEERRKEIEDSGLWRE